jgi:hypothetical protein
VLGAGGVGDTGAGGVGEAGPGGSRGGRQQVDMVVRQRCQH